MLPTLQGNIIWPSLLTSKLKLLLNSNFCGSMPFVISFVFNYSYWNVSTYDSSIMPIGHWQNLPMLWKFGSDCNCKLKPFNRYGKKKKFNYGFGKYVCITCMFYSFVLLQILYFFLTENMLLLFDYWKNKVKIDL